MSAQDHMQGHRSRLRDRFLVGGPQSLHDYEVLELILFAAKPRGDVKPLAKELLRIFKSFSGVINASHSELLKIKDLGKAGVTALKTVQLAAQLLSKEGFREKPVMSSWQHVIEYCKLSMSHLRIEQLRLLFLDHRHQLIADEVQQQGTIDQTPVYVREVIKRALELGASGLVVIHNHPSGDPTPSSADISVTKEMQEAPEKLGIMLHDHIIIGQNRHTSLRLQGVI